jgi:signal transduction histidine kinase
MAIEPAAMTSGDAAGARIAARRRGWPLTRTLPLVVAAAIFVVALLTTQVGIRVMEARELRALESKAGLLLDALADAALPHLQTGPAAVEARLAEKLFLREALAEEVLVLRWSADGAVGSGGEVLMGQGATPDEALQRLLDAVVPAAPGNLAFSHDAAGQRALAARVYALDGQTLTVAAALDTAAIQAAKKRAEGWALVIDLWLAALAAAVTYALIRRLIAPLDRLALMLAPESNAPVTSRTARRWSAEIGRLEAAVQARLEAEEARSLALRDVSEKERNALLAKLSAGLAHEVRNPLAGLLNAVSTLRRFGDNPAVRKDTLDLVERGLRSIGRVADTMLTTYRPDPGRRHFTADDLDDLRLLIATDARRRQVALDWPMERLEPIAVDADALRQILLNLLLNACKACPEGGRIGFSIAQANDATTFRIADSGQGMPDSVLAFLVDGARLAPLADQKGLGLWMVTRLLEDIGGRIKVESRAGHGTTVSVSVPTRPTTASGDGAAQPVLASAP